VTTDGSRPSPILWPRQSVEDFAGALASSLGYLEHFEISKIVADFGGRVLKKDFWEDGEGDGSLVVKGKFEFEIHIPTHAIEARNRFTIAHEFGHYVLHYRLQEASFEADKTRYPLRASRYGSGREEWEANWFAAGFLMPREHFSERCRQLGGDEYELARQFRVSVHAAQVRMQVLNLVTR
jgi:Zn-dependent peptidase ImmA (M78 family)